MLSHKTLLQTFSMGYCENLYSIKDWLIFCKKNVFEMSINLIVCVWDWNEQNHISAVWETKIPNYINWHSIPVKEILFWSFTIKIMFLCVQTWHFRKSYLRLPTFTLAQMSLGLKVRKCNYIATSMVVSHNIMWLHFVIITNLLESYII